MGTTFYFPKSCHTNWFIAFALSICDILKDAGIKRWPTPIKLDFRGRQIFHFFGLFYLCWICLAPPSKWKKVLEKIIDMADGQYYIVFMDFVANVKEAHTCMVEELKHTCLKCHGKGMNEEEKLQTMSKFRCDLWNNTPTHLARNNNNKNHYYYYYYRHCHCHCQLAILL